MTQNGDFLGQFLTPLYGTTVKVERPHARKRYACEGGCNGHIEPGTTYVRETMLMDQPLDGKRWVSIVQCESCWAENQEG